MRKSLITLGKKWNKDRSGISIFVQNPSTGVILQGWGDLFKNIEGFDSKLKKFTKE
ncbi:MAG: hypothetical protein HY606_08075 [Planctomycetes bacterium]|nr:hypothetical protein [Planctomycetota bacterium]